MGTEKGETPAKYIIKWATKFWSKFSQLHPPAIYPGERVWYPLDRRLGGPQSQSGEYGEVKILDPTDSNSDLSVVQPVTIPTMLPWLISQGKLKKKYIYAVVKNKCKSMKDDSNTDNTCRGRLI
jgi:hypothetical protein